MGVHEDPAKTLDGPWDQRRDDMSLLNLSAKSFRLIRIAKALLPVLSISLLGLPVHGQHTPVPGGGVVRITDLDSGKVIGMIDTTELGGGRYNERWLLKGNRYPVGRSLGFDVARAAEAARLQQESRSLDIDQEITYHPAPSESSIRGFATLEELVEPEQARVESFEYLLTRPGSHGRPVVQGALFQEVITYQDGTRHVRDTWRLFQNYVFPNAANPLSVTRTSSAVSQDVREFLLRHLRKGGQLATVNDGLGIESR